MSRVTVEEDSSGAPGNALIRIWGAARALQTPAFRLRRPDWAEGALGPNGWQVAEALLAPVRAVADGDDLVLHVGPAVCSHVEAGVYQIELPGAGVETTVYWPEIATPYTGRTGAFSDESRPPPPAGAPALTPSRSAAATAPLAQAAAPGSLGPTPVAAPEPSSRWPPQPASRPAPEAASRRLRWPLLVGLACVAGAGAGAGIWYFGWPARLDDRPHPVVAVPADPGQPRGPAVAADLPVRRPEPAVAPPVARGRTDPCADRDLVLRGDCPTERLATLPSEQLARLAEDLARDGDPRARSLAHRLLIAVTGRGDYPPAALALGRLYDPATFRQGGAVSAPDAARALRLYEDAATAGVPGAAAARDALAARLRAPR